MSQTSFEERLARIQQNRPEGSPDVATPQVQPEPHRDQMRPKAPLADSGIKSLLLGLFSAFRAMGTVIKIGIAVLVALAYFITPETGTRMVVASVSEFGQVKSADADGQDRYEWDTKPTPFNAARLGMKRMNAFAQDEADWNMNGLIEDAQELGQPFLAKEIDRKMKACETLVCRGKLEKHYAAKIERIRDARPRF